MSSQDKLAELDALRQELLQCNQLSIQAAGFSLPVAGAVVAYGFLNEAFWAPLLAAVILSATMFYFASQQEFIFYIATYIYVFIEDDSRTPYSGEYKSDLQWEHRVQKLRALKRDPHGLYLGIVLAVYFIAANICLEMSSWFYMLKHMTLIHSNSLLLNVLAVGPIVLTGVFIGIPCYLVFRVNSTSFYFRAVAMWRMIRDSTTEPRLWRPSIIDRFTAWFALVISVLALVSTTVVTVQQAGAYVAFSFSGFNRAAPFAVQWVTAVTDGLSICISCLAMYRAGRFAPLTRSTQTSGTQRISLASERMQGRLTWRVGLLAMCFSVIGLVVIVYVISVGALATAK